MMPWIVPGITRIEMSLFAWTGPNAFEMPRNSIAGTIASGAADGRRPGVVVASIQNDSAGQLSSEV